MRRLLLFSGLTLLVACGGATDLVAPPPPPPPPPPPSGSPGPAASVSAQAGDNQEADPGAAVPVSPAAIVRDASGHPVPGVTVVFAVSPGGGSVTGETASTDSSGVARAGSWTLGPTEGTNHLTATVASLAPATFTATAKFHAVILVDTTIGSTGGIVRYVKAGDPLSGTTLTIPAGAYPGTGRWRIERRAAASGPSLPNLRLTEPIVIVSTDQGLADSVMFLTIPRRTGADSTVAAFAWDLSGGAIEGLPLVGVTDTSFTIAARHFSSGLFLSTTPPRSSSFSAPRPIARSIAAVAPLPFSVAVFNTPVPTNPVIAFNVYAAGGAVTTGFDPAADAWEFPNFGSYVAPLGQLTGTSLSELYYHTAAFSGALPHLFGTYNPNFKPVWAGDNLGYRVAALTETDIDWASARAAVTAVESGSLVNANLNNRGVDVVNYNSLLATMVLTGRPQVFIIQGPPASGGWVGLVAYKITPTEVWAADPDHPGSSIVIPFLNGRFQSIQLGMMSGIPPFTATKFHFAAASALLNFARIGANFAAMLQGGPVGQGVFPGYTIQYFDEDLQQWTNLPTTPLTIDWQDVALRAFCPSCQRTIPGQTAGLTALDVYDVHGTQIASDRVIGKVTFRVPPGGEVVGIHVLGGVDVCAGCQVVWRHVDFQALSIHASQIYILPDPAAGTSNAPLTFTAHNIAAGTPANARYFWNFGNGTTATVNGDSTVAHAWGSAGTYPVTVVVIDVNTGNQIGKASATALIDEALPIWRFTSLTKTTAGLFSVFADAFGILGDMYAVDIVDMMDNFRAAPFTGLLYYMASPFTVAGQSLPPGVYLQRDLGGNFPGFDPRQENAVLAQPTKASYVDAFIDDLITDAPTRAGDLDNGTFRGLSVTRLRDLNGWPGVGGVHTATHWQVSAVENGKLLTGNITWFIERWELTCPIPALPCSNALITGTFNGTYKISYDFTAQRLR